MNKKIVTLMKAKLILLAVAVATMAACGGKTLKFKADDGSVTATVKEGSGEWRFVGADGNDLVKGYDSLRVVEIDSTGSPVTVCFYLGQEQLWLQFYPDMSKRSEGRIVDGLREGSWAYYFPNGSVQAEATYMKGLEEGLYVVYRENGIPYYRGYYHAGQESDTWEFYDANGTLISTKTY